MAAITSAYAAATADCPLARRTRVTSLVRCMGYSSWSIVHWYMFLYLSRVQHKNTKRCA